MFIILNPVWVLVKQKHYLNMYKNLFCRIRKKVYVFCLLELHLLMNLYVRLIIIWKIIVYMKNLYLIIV
jgi:hypothetical protein